MVLKATKRSWFRAFLFCILLSTAAAGCDPDDTATSTSTYKAGVYKAAATGHKSITVSVTFSDEEITDVTIVSHNETLTVDENDPEKDDIEGDLILNVTEALAEIPLRIVAAQSADVDGVSGASETSNGIKTAVRRCIILARN